MMLTRLSILKNINAMKIFKDWSVIGIIFLTVGTLMAQGVIFMLGCAFLLADLLKCWYKGP